MVEKGFENSRVLRSEWKTERVIKDESSDSEDGEDELQGCFDGGSEGFDPPQEVADPPRKFCRTSLGGGLTLTPLRTPLILFSCKTSIFMYNYAPLTPL